MKIQKAVITAAGQNQRALPLQTLIDRDGQEKSVLGILIEQALAAKVEEICVVVWPGDETRYAQAAGKRGGRVRFVPQPQPLGYGHAIYCAREFTGGEPFLHLVGDHLYVSSTSETLRATAGGPGAGRRMRGLRRAAHARKPAAALRRRGRAPRAGTPGALSRRDGHRKAHAHRSRAAPGRAPGLRAGHYLCFFGMHVLTPAVMDLLGRSSERRARHAFRRAGRTGPPRAIPGGGRTGRRYDIGARYGLLIAQMALALNGRDRSEVLAQLLELLATGTWRRRPGAASEPPDRRHRRERSRRATARSTRSAKATLEELLAECEALDRFRRSSDNLYERVRALFFLYAIHRFHIPLRRRRGSARSSPSPATPTC